MRLFKMFSRAASAVGIVGLLGLFLFSTPASAQTAIDNTTLSAAVTNSQQFVTLAAVTCTGCTFAKGNNIVIYVDLEAMCMNDSYVSGTTVPVTRGCLGTVAAAHSVSNLGVNNVVYYGPQNRFHQAAGGGATGGNPPFGNCAPRTQYLFLPWINISNGLEWVCDNVNWRSLSIISTNGSTPSR